MPCSIVFSLFTADSEAQTCQALKDEKGKGRSQSPFWEAPYIPRDVAETIGTRTWPTQWFAAVNPGTGVLLSRTVWCHFSDPKKLLNKRNQLLPLLLSYPGHWSFLRGIPCGDGICIKCRIDGQTVLYAMNERNILQIKSDASRAWLYMVW